MIDLLVKLAIDGENRPYAPRMDANQFLTVSILIDIVTVSIPKILDAELWDVLVASVFLVVLKIVIEIILRDERRHEVSDRK